MTELLLEDQSNKDNQTIREILQLRVYVVGGGFQYIKMFHDAGFTGARNVEDADIVCFTGGEDVSPSLYGETPIPGTSFNPKRDDFEAYIYGEALALQKPMIGICRGSQFLNVMNGGKLWQDVDNHAVRGGHDVVDVRTGEIKRGMTSTHHQQMIQGDNAEVIAMAAESSYKKGYDLEVHRAMPELDDVEVLWYPDSLSLLFQPHPEFQFGPCRTYFLDLVDEFVIPAC